MAVHQHEYTAWKGSRTDDRLRFLVLPRYAFQQVFASRPFTFFFALAFLPLAFSLATIYAFHNLGPLQDLGIDVAQAGIELEFGAEKFEVLQIVQGWFVTFLAVFVGPGLVSRDLVNNGLPLILARPISRPEYVLGKGLVLALLMSAITWAPMTVLFGLQVSLAPDGWATGQLFVPLAILFGSCLWIVVVSLLALAISAWVRWRPVAALGILVVVFGGKLVAAMIEGLFDTALGQCFNLGRLIRIVWAHLYRLEEVPDGPPLLVAAFLLAFFAATCIGMLHLKVRAYEVVR